MPLSLMTVKHHLFAMCQLGVLVLDSLFIGGDAIHNVVVGCFAGWLPGDLNCSSEYATSSVGQVWLQTNSLCGCWLLCWAVAK